MNIRFSYYIALACLPFCIAALFSKRRTTMLISFIIIQNFIADTLALNFPKENLIIYNLNSLLEAGIIIYLYCLNMIKPPRWIIFISVILFILSILNLTFFQGLRVFHIYTYLPIGLFIALISLVYISNEIDQREKFPELEMHFFALANIFYYACHIPVIAYLFLFIKKDSKFAVTLFSINTVLYSIWLILITLGLQWKNLRKILSSS
jgi:hypothetical protein